MVAISLYKGNLHRSPDTPRQWLMPARKISLKEFKVLLERRSRALSRLQSNQPTTSNPNPNSDHSGREQPQSNGFLKVIVDDSSAFKVDGVDESVNSDEDDDCKKGSTGDDDDDDSLVIPSGELVAQEVAAAKAVVQENGSNGAVDCLQQGEKLQTTAGDQLESPKDDTLSDREKRKKEIEEKLQILNDRKHKLVQVLKQILHAEEELRRRNNVQVNTGRPIISLQVDVTNDSGSMSRHVTPRPGSEGTDGELADTDDVSNQNTHPRNMTRMSSMSPSSDSLHRRTPFSMVGNPSRGGVASSPSSRFAPTPTGNGHLPSVSASVTGSSPSPVASGGTSVFRDATRLPSPWN